MGSKYKKLSHMVNKCDYHVVWTLEYRYRVLFGEVKSLVKNDIRMLCDRKSVKVTELDVLIDHVQYLYQYH